MIILWPPVVRVIEVMSDERLATSYPPPRVVSYNSNTNDVLVLASTYPTRLLNEYNRYRQAAMVPFSRRCKAGPLPVASPFAGLGWRCFGASHGKPQHFAQHAFQTFAQLFADLSPTPRWPRANTM
jgi:hypothetical protein